MATTITIEYAMPVSLSLEKVKEALIDNLKLKEVTGEQRDITCLDTFDWLVYGQNYCLEASEQSGTVSLRCRPLHSRKYTYKISTTGDCQFYWDLPESLLRERLKKWIKVRALLPRLYLRVRRHELVKLNRENKTVLRILLENVQVRGTDSGPYKKLQKRLHILPVRGYPNAERQAVCFIESEWRLGKPQKDIVVTGLNALGRQPEDYSSKSSIVLRGEMHTEQAVRLLLSEMLDIMRANENGIRNDIDAEFLHDYRVAIRKTRSLLRQVKQVFPQRKVDQFANQFSWLGTVTGPARDMDVYLLEFESYQSMLPEELRGHLEPLRQLLDKKRQSAYKKLARTFDTKRYRQFFEAYHEFLQSQVTRSAAAVNARRPVQLVANERIWKVYKKAMKEGGAIDEDSPAEDLHELRKTFKKLRYLIEFFKTLYEPKAVKRLINAMKSLQDNLGNLNDYHVQAETLHAFSEELMAQQSASDETRQAMDYLVSHLEGLQTKERAGFAELFSIFSDAKITAEFRRLFKGHTSATTAEPE
ncbi:MAG: CHAD domain-containing protein [Gammaproteobacteria bacterium]|jgi:CHAD domain-containing protein